MSVAIRFGYFNRAKADTQPEDANNYSGTVVARLGNKVGAGPAKDAYSAEQPLPEGSLVYSLWTHLTPDALAARKYRGYSGNTSVVLRTAHDGQTQVRSYPLELNADDYVVGMSWLGDSTDRLILRVGSIAGGASTADIYLLDVHNNSLTRVVVGSSFGIVSSSPDGRLLAFVRGTDLYGYPLSGAVDEDSKTDRVGLYVFDTTSLQEMLVSTGNSLTCGGWCWTPRNTLLYARLPILEEDPTKKKRTFKTLNKPSIYEFDAKKGKSEKVIADAWRPILSPDGQKIAYMGSEDAGSQATPLNPNWRFLSNGQALCIFDRQTEKRKCLNREMGLYPRVLWRDNESLFTVNSNFTGKVIQEEIRLRKINSVMSEHITNLRIRPRDEGSTDSDYSPIRAPVELVDWDEKARVLYFYQNREGKFDRSSGYNEVYVDIMKWTSGGGVARVGTLAKVPCSPLWMHKG